MAIPDRIKARLQELPDKPGVYVMRDRRGKIIYVGKATSLRSRVRHYFQQGTLRSADPKLRGLIRSVEDLEILPVRTEAEALLVEARMIKEYRPRYNVYFRDDKRFLLIRVDPREPWPRFDLCRLDKGDGARYFGPYPRAGAARAAVEFIEKRHGLRSCRPVEPGPEHHRHCHFDIVRFCTAPCVGKIARDAYLARVEEACAFLRGERADDLVAIEAEMTAAAEALDFERAAALRDILLHLRHVVRQRAKGLKSLDLQHEEARAGLGGLREALGLPVLPHLIECFDISNISGTHAVASMVAAVDGMPSPARYRRFRIKTVEGSDDPAMMAEVVRRRYARLVAENRPMPDLVIVDGGVTQLGAARRELAALGLGRLPSAGLAKRFEEIHTAADLAEPPLRLPPDSPALKVLRRLRDEAHRFALSYHRTLRSRRIRESFLDEIENIGEKRKELLLAHFGSLGRLRRASAADIAAVSGIGPVLAAEIQAALHRRWPAPSEVEGPAPGEVEGPAPGEGGPAPGDKRGGQG